MVRVAGLMGQAASGLAVRSADGLHAAARRSPQIRERVLELTARQSRALEARAPAGARRRAGIVVASVDELRPRRAGRARRALRARDLPGADAARRRAGPAVPVHLAASRSASACSSRDPETGEERFARVKVPERLPRFLAVGARGLLLPLETRDRALPAVALSRDGDRRARGLPRHARRRLRGLGRGGRPARGGASSSSAGAASATSSALEVSSSMSSAMLERLDGGLGVRRRADLPDRRPARPRRARPDRRRSTGPS